MIKKFKEKLPSLKDIILIFRRDDFTLISEAIKRQYFEKMARTARFSLQLTEEEDLLKKSQMISWIAEGQEVEIDVTKSIERNRKNKICSDF
jgi:hypothetical protein